jgi:hypothetical protein
MQAVSSTRLVGVYEGTPANRSDCEVKDSYAPVLQIKEKEVRLLIAIAAQHGVKIYGTDTKGISLRRNS